MPTLLLKDPEKGGGGGGISKLRCTSIFIFPVSIFVKRSPPPPSSLSPPLPPLSSKVRQLLNLFWIVLFALFCAAIAFLGMILLVDSVNGRAIDSDFSAEAFCAAFGNCKNCSEEITPNFYRYQRHYLAFFRRELERAKIDPGAKCRHFLALQCKGVLFAKAEEAHRKAVAAFPKLIPEDDHQGITYTYTEDGLRSLVRKFCVATVSKGSSHRSPKIPLCRRRDCAQCVSHNVDCLNISPTYLMDPGAWTCNTPEEWAALEWWPQRDPLRTPPNCTVMMSEQFPVTVYMPTADDVKIVAPEELEKGWIPVNFYQ